MPNCSASDAAAAMLVLMLDRMSMGSALSSAIPASYRLISSRSASSDSNRSSSSTISSVALARCGGKSSRPACSTSAAIRTVVSGVRSSCETSEVNRRCSLPNSSSCRICTRIASAIPLNELASVVSSIGPLTGIRSARSPAASLRALDAARRTGRTTCEATSAEISVSARASTMPPTSRVRWTTCTVPCSPASGKIR